MWRIAAQKRSASRPEGPAVVDIRRLCPIHCLTIPVTRSERYGRYGQRQPRRPGTPGSACSRAVTLHALGESSRVRPLPPYRYSIFPRLFADSVPSVPQAEPPSGCRSPWLPSRETRLPASREGAGCGTPSRWAFSLVPTCPRVRPWLPAVGVGWRGRRWSGQHRTVRRPRECCIRRCAPGTPDALPAYG